MFVPTAVQPLGSNPSPLLLHTPRHLDLTYNKIVHVRMSRPSSRPSSLEYVSPLDVVGARARIPAQHPIGLVTTLADSPVAWSRKIKTLKVWCACVSVINIKTLKVWCACVSVLVFAIGVRGSSSSCLTYVVPALRGRAQRPPHSSLFEYKSSD